MKVCLMGTVTEVCVNADDKDSEPIWQGVLPGFESEVIQAEGPNVPREEEDNRP